MKVSYILWALLLIFLFTECSDLSMYGRLRGVSQKDISITSLVDNFNSFYVYFSGPNRESAAAVIFDPKDDQREIVVEKGWEKVEDKRSLKEIIHWMRADILFPPRLNAIIGPDNQVYGYIFTYLIHIYTRSLGNQRLWIGYLPLPPIDYGGDFMKSF